MINSRRTSRSPV